jgi:hypothetical protein
MTTAITKIASSAIAGVRNKPRSAGVGGSIAASDEAYASK